MSGFTVVVVEDIPTPYRIAVLKAIQAEAPFRLCVVWLAARGREKHWQLDAGSLDHYAPADLQLYLPSSDIRLQLTWGLGRILRRLRPDLLTVGNYFHPGNWLCLLYARMRRIPLVFWSETTLSYQRHGGRLARTVKGWFIGRCAGFLACGSAAAEFLAGFGVPESRISRVINTTDLHLIRRGWQREQAAEAAPRTGPLRLLFVGRLTRLKGVALALKALARLHGRGAEFEFRICGDGHDRAELAALTDRLGLAARVQFVGYVQQEHLPAHLAWADVFLFPTLREIWGMVVNEALAAGLFVLSSTLAGATQDLIDGELMGLPIDPRSEASLDHGLSLVLERLPEIRADRERRSAAAMAFDADCAARAFIAAVLQIPRK